MQDFDKLFDIPMVALITTGRTGTDFLQSTFDLHPQILTFNGSLWLHQFWAKSICVKNSRGKIDLDDLVFEFIGLHIEKLKSRYDFLERKDQLGVNSNEFIDIDLDKFRVYIKEYLVQKEINSKSFLLAVYASYGKLIGQKLSKIQVIIHHIHHYEKLPPFIKDFPKSKIICMTRDPRANFVSLIENHRRYNKNTDHNSFIYFQIRRILIDSTMLKAFPNNYLTIRLEDLGDLDIINKLCIWLGISYHSSLKYSTWGGLQWRGDRVSEKKNETKGFSKNMISNKWKSKLSFLDKYILNFLMNDRLKHYGYSYKKIIIFDYFIVFFLLIKPLSFELRFIHPNYIIDSVKTRSFRILISNFYYYLMRVLLFYKYYFRIIGNEKFNEPILKT